MNANELVSQLRLLKTNYFNHDISVEQYQAARTDILDGMEQLINGRQIADARELAIDSSDGPATKGVIDKDIFS